MNIPLTVSSVDVNIQQVNIVDMLNQKLLEFKSNKDIPTEASLVDFIGYSVTALDQGVEQLKHYKSTIQEKINQILDFKREFLMQGARFFKEHNYSRLEGIEISSITISPPKEESVEVKNLFESDYSKKELEQILVRLGYGSYKTVREHKPARAAMLKINRRKNTDMPNFAELLFSKNLKQVTNDGQ